MEIWKAILNYEGLYQASNLGRVRSLNYNRTGETRILKPGKNNRGYLHVDLYKDGKQKTYKVHRLVWESFIGKIPEGYEVNHIDEDKENNFVYVNPDGSVDLQKSNLNLMTHKENLNWGTRTKKVAEKLTNGKLSVPLYQIIPETGQIVREWPSTAECGRNGFNQSNVAACCRNCYFREGNNIYKGYRWVTVENFYKKCI